MPVGETNKNKANLNEIRAKDKNKFSCDKKAVNRLFVEGDHVLIRSCLKNKFDLKGDVGVVVKQFDTHNVLVRDLKTTRTFRCSSSRLSPLPKTATPETLPKGITHGTPSKATDGTESNDDEYYTPLRKSPSVRRSGRVRLAPDWLQYH